MAEWIDLTGEESEDSTFPSLSYLENVVIELSSESDTGTPVKPKPKRVKIEQEEAAVKRELWPDENDESKSVSFCEKPDIEYYNGDSKLPVYMKHDKTYRFTVERLCNIMLDPNIDNELVCTAQPTRVSHNVTFVVDCTYLADRKDILADDLGAWVSKGSRKTRFAAKVSSGIVSVSVDSSEQDQYVMYRSWHTHGTSADFRRLVVFIEDPSGKMLDLAVVAYTFTKGPEHEVLIRPHGNSHSSQPYQRTMPSTLNQLKAAKDQPAKAAVSEIVRKQGGLIGARSAGHLPRDQKQVYNARQQKTANVSSSAEKERSDVLYYLMEQSRKCTDSEVFVRDVKAVPEPMCVLATDHQLDDMVRFCTDPNEFAVLCIDPTFCIGDFNVTPIVYKHLLLESRRYEAPPTVHGPILVHQKKEFSSYYYFLSTLIGLRPQLKAVQAFGSDGEESLVQALKSCFPWGQQLRCFLHMRRNIKSKLSELRISSTSSSVILADIFGKTDGTNFQEGLVDASGEDLFFSQLEGMETKWNELEQADSSQNPKFFDWFQKYQGHAFANAMIAPKREAAGLGSPAAEFTTNICESGHFALKNYLPKRGQCSWQEFVQKSLQFVQDQYREVEMAVLDRGQYRFKKQYSSLVVGNMWFKMNSAQQEAHLKRVHTQKLCGSLGALADEKRKAVASTDSIEPSQSLVGASNADASLPDASFDSAGKSPETGLSVSCEAFVSRIKLPQSTVVAIWQKAEMLLTSKSSIVLAPGKQDSWYVESTSKQVPHLVRVSPKGAISCDKACEHYRSIGICSHTVAIAHKTESLEAFTNSFIKKKGSRCPNLGNFALTGMPAGRNRKGEIPPRKRLPRSASSLLPHLPLNVSSHQGESGHLQTSKGETSKASSGGNGMAGFSRRLSDGGSSSTVFSDELPEPPYLQQHYSSFPSVLPYSPVGFGPSVYHQSLGHASSQYSPPYSYSLPAFPSPTPDSPFVLKLLNHMLKVCAGCRGGYTKKPDGSLPDPPYDICVSHETVITLTNPLNKTPFRKPTKSHYHAYPSCIFLKNPTFNPSSLVVPSEIVPKLTAEHWQYLESNFGIYPPANYDSNNENL